VVGLQRLRRASVARVSRAAGRLAMRLVAEMIGQLDLERSLHQPLGQLRKQPAGPDDLLLGLRAGQQLVDHPIRELTAHVIRHALQDPTGAPPARMTAGRRRHTVSRQSLDGLSSSLWL
jgi:hypothetical protein